MDWHPPIPHAPHLSPSLRFQRQLLSTRECGHSFLKEPFVLSPLSLVTLFPPLPSSSITRIREGTVVRSEPRTSHTPGKCPTIHLHLYSWRSASFQLKVRAPNSTPNQTKSSGLFTNLKKKIFFTMVKSTTWGQQDGSAYKVPCCHTAQPAFALQDPRSGRRELTPHKLSSDLHTHTMASTHVHTQHINKCKKKLHSLNLAILPSCERTARSRKLTHFDFSSSPAEFFFFAH